MDDLKRAIRNLAFSAFFNGEELPINNPVITGYEVSHTDMLFIQVKVPMPAGPRFFEIRVSEKQ